jgi:hypothetical protein
MKTVFTAQPVDHYCMYKRNNCQAYGKIEKKRVSRKSSLGTFRENQKNGVPAS